MRPGTGGKSALRDEHPRLVDGRTGQSFWVTKDTVLIGRHRSCDIIIPVVEVSRRHCKIYIDDGVYYVEDLRTVNGTYVNEKAIHAPQLLQDGFHLKVAKCSKYPAGVKNYIFRVPASMKHHASSSDDAGLDAETKSIKKDLLRELQEEQTDELVQAKKKSKKKLVELRHCVLRVARKREEPRQVPLAKYAGGEIGFLSLSEVNTNEQLRVELSHPTWPEPLLFATTIQRVGKIKDRPVYQVEGSVEMDEATEDAFGERVKPGPPIKYFA